MTGLPNRHHDELRGLRAAFASRLWPPDAEPVTTRVSNEMDTKR
jgi:hypothetical protein